MKKRFLVLSFLLFIICSFNLLAINFPEKTNKVEGFIPKGWKSIIIKKGDLNKDKIDDIVLVIEKNDSKNIKKSESTYEASVVHNFNPRIILVLFKDKDSQYNLVAKNEDGFIVSEGKSYEEGFEKLASPNNDKLSDSIAIKNNTLHIYTYFEATRSSNSTEYIFRYQNNRFELIGLESNSNGASGGYVENSNYSFNFSTKKLKKYLSREDMTTEEKPKEEKTEKDIDVENKYILDTMKENTLEEILTEYIYKYYN
ncbi:hypothetical protein [Fusobacterium sp. oral taxon 203]|uniref:hypothetical protein n=1 Tax=Fusobacterium sp. oral taxon 203 TaxID=671211 RepID=UPI000B92C625|nr:hypothetical protein [Fusobacterium sp. oral taxon 203]ASS39516.1 hypothetical protein AXF16_05340 [Fusobacterium sp. oral taxon 203]